jgi:hypothetical protein
MAVPRMALRVGRSADGSERAHRLRKGALAMGADVKARIVFYSMVLSFHQTAAVVLQSGASKARDARTSALRQQQFVLPVEPPQLRIPADDVYQLPQTAPAPQNSPFFRNRLHNGRQTNHRRMCCH